MAGYHRNRSTKELLKLTDSCPPSFTVHLHSDHWFLNNSTKFLYNQPIASLLDDIRAQRIPVDYLELFDQAKVPYYDGCMIVELLDYRPQRPKEPSLEKPERSRVLLQPDPESIWADLCLLNQKFGAKMADFDAFEIEARILVATAEPLCLDPDVHLARVANCVTRITKPSVPASLKRKAAAMDPEEDETDKARRAKIMQIWNPSRSSRPIPTSFPVLAAIEKIKSQGKTQVPAIPKEYLINPPASATQLPPLASPPKPTLMPLASVSAKAPPTAAEVKSQAQKPKAKPAAIQSPQIVPRPAPTPIPLQGTAQFHPHTVSTHQPTAGQQVIQSHVYAALQNGESSKRVASPVRYAHSPPVVSPPPPPATPHQPTQPHPLPAYPTNPTPSHYPSSPAALRNGQAKAQRPNAATPQPMQQMSAQQMHYYAQLGAVAAANGRSTPQTVAHARSPLLTNQAAAQTRRSSPMVTTLSANTRSPMPANAQIIPHLQHQHTMQSIHPTQYTNLRMMAPPHNVQGGAQMMTAPSPLGPGQPQHQQQPQQQRQQQQQPQPHPQQPQPPSANQEHGHVQQTPLMTYPAPMYRYTYQIPGGPMSQYWHPGPGRGIPSGVMDGQHMPGMQPNGAHPQQMTLGVGKIAPQSIQRSHA